MERNIPRREIFAYEIPFFITIFLSDRDAQIPLQKVATEWKTTKSIKLKFRDYFSSNAECDKKARYKDAFNEIVIKLFSSHFKRINQASRETLQE